MKKERSKNWRDLWVVRNWGSAVLAVAVALGVGLVLGWGLRPATLEVPAEQITEIEGEQIWTCSMHPQVRQPKPGKCPICQMDLIPIDKDQAAQDRRKITFSTAAAALMDVETVAVERKSVTAEVRMVGNIDYDETRVAYITAWVPGRLDRLFVDYTGIPVRKGDHMVEIYSPELLSAQEEFLQAHKAKGGLKSSDSELIRESVEATFDAVYEKLRLWGLTAGQMDELAERGTPSDHLTIYAPAGGIVVRKHVNQGDYVNTGTRIYTIADLSKLWVRLDAYESELAWLRYGQEVELTTESLPGRKFKGTISFIDPVLNEQTRTVRVRVNVDNADGAIKPGMFVAATVRSRLTAGGKVMEPNLAGKWISPMHPEIVKDEPGKCDICGMPLVRAEELGYVSADVGKRQQPLVIPTSAALLTGEQAVVFVEVPGTKNPTFEMREITLGPRAGSYYLVEGGLSEQERVVFKGNFMIDSERQIRGLPSMMHREGVGAEAHVHAERAKPKEPEPAADAPIFETPLAFRRQLWTVFESYFKLGDALAADDFAQALAAAKASRTALNGVNASLLTGQAFREWRAQAATVDKLLTGAIASKGIEPLRADFALLSEQMVLIAKSFGAHHDVVYQMRCPMAFSNRGATWLQLDEKVRNPYFGASMLRCGGVIGTIQPLAVRLSGHRCCGAAA
ncbi:MAG: efflux RND transporter periplasmic adaptor subunit [Planctomycetota bacterium]|jgi:Cu(I)/Ag(I) efflux system membrane fusion protein